MGQPDKVDVWAAKERREHKRGSPGLSFRNGRPWIGFGQSLALRWYCICTVVHWDNGDAPLLLHWWYMYKTGTAQLSS